MSKISNDYFNKWRAWNEIIVQSAGLVLPVFIVQRRIEKYDRRNDGKESNGYDKFPLVVPWGSRKDKNTGTDR